MNNNNNNTIVESKYKAYITKMQEPVSNMTITDEKNKIPKKEFDRSFPRPESYAKPAEHKKHNEHAEHAKHKQK